MANKLRDINTVVVEATRFHDEIEARRDFNTLVGEKLVLIEAKIVKDFNTSVGRHDMAMLLLSDNEDNYTDVSTQFTTVCSGFRVVQQVEELTKKHAFPVNICPSFNPTKDDRGYFKL